MSESKEAGSGVLWSPRLACVCAGFHLTLVCKPPAKGKSKRKKKKKKRKKTADEFFHCLTFYAVVNATEWAKHAGSGGP